ncbi:MAG TPA: hypothetical protein VK970_15595 [Candidatus Methylacidiphilales bacterium]|nr:hypothetical protein [Candidatus Methylacidiphilales bacterium]
MPILHSSISYGHWSGRGRVRRARGVVLLAVLLFILLFSVMVVSFMASMQIDRASSQNFGRSIAAQEIAWGGLQEVVGDLGKEIDAGSLPDGTPAGAIYSQSSVRVYIPTTNYSAMPARIGYPANLFRPSIATTNLPATLLRVSRATDPFFTSPPVWYDSSKLPVTRASAVPTTTTSADGRTFPASRWNKPQLMGATLPVPFSNSPPDWVYVTRSGSKPFTAGDLSQVQIARSLSQTNQVLGRYAYVVYDTSGLLDMNVAGYTATGATASPKDISGKGYSAYADMTQLPGLTNKQPAIDKVVNWRSKGGLAAAPSYVEAMQRYATNGFLSFKPGDNPILGRQDLIRYFEQLKADGSVADLSALSYLTTFSRSVSGPSWKPATPAGSSIPYGDIADTSSSVNRTLANVRFPSAKTVTHYFDYRTFGSYTVKAGDPLLQTRFSLARLDWLKLGNSATGSGPAPTSPDGKAIRDCFGLVWDRPGLGVMLKTTANGGNYCWNYVDESGNIATTIKTLAEVAAEGREPNFFELLKATILRGSLGMGPGPAAFKNGDPTVYLFPSIKYASGYPDLTGQVGLFSHTFGFYSTIPVPSRIPDVQIIQIGANIIDQFDTDSYPTAIYFRYSEVGDKDPVTGGAGALPIFGPVTMVFGIENLPYLSRIFQVNGSPHRSDTAAAGGPPSEADDATDNLGGWRQPELWNPHQEPASPLVDAPRKFQIRAYGSAYTKWGWQFTPPKPPAPGPYYAGGTSEPVDYYLKNDNTEVCDLGTLSFEDSSPTSSFYAAPRLLVRDTLPGVTATSKDPRNVADDNMPDAAWKDTGNKFALQNHFVAFCTGITPKEDLGGNFKPFYVKMSTGTALSINVDNPANTFVLGWVDSSNQFHPYSYITGQFTYAYLEMQNKRIGSANPDKMAPDRYGLVDPRTARFSLHFSLFGGAPKSNTTYSTATVTTMPTSTSFVSTTKVPGDWGVNNTTAKSYYADPDGVVRPADGVYRTAKNDGFMLYTSDGTTTDVPFATGDKGNVQHARRPVILNRPFRSVGELGYVFRDQPFRTLDFFTNLSADNGLLDVFITRDQTTIIDEQLSTVTAGQINPCNALIPVIQAVLAGSSKKDIDLVYNIKNEASNLAQAIAAQLHPASGSCPLLNRADLVTQLSTPIRNGFSGTSDKSNKAYLEAPIRALSNVTNTRTWNLMIDIVAQSGRISANATALKDFHVEGERRYWLHIAIDRYTGKIIDQQLEAVYE